MDKLKLWILAGALAVVPAVMAVVRLRRRRKAEAGKEAQQAPQTPEKGLPQPDPVITVGIQKYADRFMGLYSGVCAAQQEVPATGDSYREWRLRMEGLREDEGCTMPSSGISPETAAHRSSFGCWLPAFMLLELLRMNGSLLWRII